MVDKKISGLTVVTVPAAGDSFVLVDVSENPDQNKRITFANFEAALDIANFTTTATSAEMRALISDETGTGLAVFGTSPTLITPVITGSVQVTDRMGMGAAPDNAWLDLNRTIADADKLSNLEMGVSADLTLTNDDESTYQLIGINSAMRYVGSQANTDYRGLRCFEGFVDKKSVGTLTNAAGIRLDLRNTVGTTSSMTGLHVIGATQSGTAITNFYGVKIDANATAGNNYAIHTNIAASTGDFNIYAAGTAINHFAGKVGVGTATPTGVLEVSVASGTTVMRLITAGGGYEAVSQTQPQGVDIVTGAGAMSATHKYGSGVRFGSSDGAFTTTSPKFLAGIYPRATEGYDADTDGGMAIDFFVSPDNPGTAPAPTFAATISEDGYLGIGATDPIHRLQLGSHVGAMTGITADASFSGAGTNPVILALYRNAGGGAGVMNTISFNGKDSGANLQEYARIEGNCEDNISGSEDGSLIFYGASAGTTTEVMRMMGLTGLLDVSSGSTGGVQVDNNARYWTKNNAGTQVNVFYMDAGDDIYFGSTGNDNIFFQNDQGTVLTIQTGTGNIGIGVPTPTSLCHIGASTTARASLNLSPLGAAPPSSPVDGDMWTTSAGLYVQINGGTVGPLS